MTEMNEVAAQIMEHLCTDPRHGYSQGGNRWGNGEKEYLTIDGKVYSFYGGDRDCSSAVISAYQAAGLNVNATYTGNMCEGFLATGMFESRPLSFIAQRGDIYLNDKNHTAMCTSSYPDTLAEFCINEFGQIIGGQEGDQTGQESRIGSYYEFPWDRILHFTGGECKTPSVANTIDDFNFAIYTSGCWYKSEGEIGYPISYITINMPGWYQVKTEARGWLEPVRGFNPYDFEYGCAGDGSAIIGVRCYYETPDPSVTGWKKIQYQVHKLGGDWYPLMEDLRDLGGSNDDFAGDGLTRIDGFRAKII